MEPSSMSRNRSFRFDRRRLLATTSTESKQSHLARQMIMIVAISIVALALESSHWPLDGDKRTNEAWEMNWEISLALSHFNVV